MSHDPRSAASPETQARPVAAAAGSNALPSEKPDDRRRSPRRRLRDRIASLDHADSPLLRTRHDLKNHLLLVEDDLRQTALSLGPVEQYLEAALSLLEKPDLRPDELLAHADDEDVLDRMDMLVENLANLRRRMSSIAGAMKASPKGPAA